jgi:hypothetical protein
VWRRDRAVQRTHKCIVGSPYRCCRARNLGLHASRLREPLGGFGLIRTYNDALPVCEKEGPPLAAPELEETHRQQRRRAVTAEQVIRRSAVILVTAGLQARRDSKWELSRRA